MTTDRPAAAPRPSGRREDRGVEHLLVLERTFRAPAADVWAAVTEPERLRRWIGTWDGDPASGTVAFRMTAEGEDIEPTTTTIHECDPPRRLVVSWAPETGGGPRWHIEVDLAEEAGTTRLTFTQRVPDRATGRDVGGGWEYYLDRLVAAETGGEVGAVGWSGYEAMSGHYAALFDDLG